MSVREPYHRTYVLLPPDADINLARLVLEATWDQCRWTVGGSADDAGLGDLEHKRVLAINPAGWGGDLAEFFQQYYPGTEYIPIAGNEFQVRGRLLAQMLLDWNIILSPPTTHQPLVVTSEFGDPRNSYLHNGLDLRSSDQMWGDRVLAAIDGQVVIAGKTKDEPWYGIQVRILSVLGNVQLWVRYAHLKEAMVERGAIVKTGDIIGLPDATGDATGDHLHIDVKAQIDSLIGYVDPWMLIRPPSLGPAPLPPSTAGTLLGLHFMPAGAINAEEYLQMVQPMVFKSVTDIQALRWAGQICPRMALVYRHWVPDQDQFLHASDKMAAAREWLRLFGDEVAGIARELKRSIWVESLNETYSHDLAQNQEAISFDLAFCQAIAESNLPLKPVVFTAAVGNPGLTSEYLEPLLPLAKEITRLGGFLGYHAYWPIHLAPPDSYIPDLYLRTWPVCAGRWMVIDDYFSAHNIHPLWFLGEIGAVGAQADEKGNVLAFDPRKGWRALPGGIDEYIRQLLQVQARYHAWNVGHGNRLIGGTVFTTGGWGWDSFNLAGNDLLRLAEVLRS